MSPLEEMFFKKYGVGAHGGSAIGIARGTSEGKVDPMLSGLSNEDLASLDRVQFNRQVTGENPLVGGLGAASLAILDALKGTGIQNKLGPVIAAVGGSGDHAAEWAADEHTSRPSAGQAWDNIRGFGLGIQDIMKLYGYGE